MSEITPVRFLKLDNSPQGKGSLTALPPTAANDLKKEWWAVPRGAFYGMKWAIIPAIMLWVGILLGIAYTFNLFHHG